VIDGRTAGCSKPGEAPHPICSAGTPSTAAIAARASAPGRTSAREQRRCRFGGPISSSRLGAHRYAGPALRNSRAPATHSIVSSARPRIKGGIVKPTLT
jgi:hypothetical protein